MKISELLEAYTPPPGYKIHDGESWERPASAPLIWRAVKHAEEKGQRVWSEIPGAAGNWTIRNEPGYKDGDERRYFYIRVTGDDGSDTWFELVPDDDDTLAICPDGDGDWEVYDQGGRFKV